jgi:hypothetical protein
VERPAGAGPPEAEFTCKTGLFLRFDMAVLLLIPTARMVKLGKSAGGRANTKTVKLLLGSNEGRLNTVIETLVRDVCGEHAILQTTRATHVGEFTRHGSQEQLDLIILIPDHLEPDFSPQGSPGTEAEAVRAIETIKRARATPVLVFSVGERGDSAFLEAGAEYDLEIPFKCDDVKAVVRRLVPLVSHGEESSPSRWSLAGLLRSGFPRFGQT